MTEYSRGGYISGVVEATFRRGPIREAVDPDHLSIYEDECIINRDGRCTRTDEGHAGVPIPADRIWACPAHGD